MTLTIWKYPVSLADSFELERPGGAKLLHLDVQNGQPFMWFLLNPNMPTVARAFYVRGTGHDCEALEQCTHRGSFMLQNGSFVFHVFEEP